jgi:hypothetical protein
MSVAIGRQACLAGTWLLMGLSIPAVEIDVVSASEMQTRVNPDAQLILEFHKRVEEYLRVLKTAEAGIAEVPEGAPFDQVDAHQRALQRSIAKARARAKAGDIFTQPTRAYFRRQVGRVLSGPDAVGLKAEIMEGNPGRIQLQVNARYPDTLPVSTMPQQILAALPKLPKELEFRYIGDRLILLDSHSRVIVDYMDSAIPN